MYRSPHQVYRLPTCYKSTHVPLDQPSVPIVTKIHIHTRTDIIWTFIIQLDYECSNNIGTRVDVYFGNNRYTWLV